MKWEKNDSWGLVTEVVVKKIPKHLCWRVRWYRHAKFNRTHQELMIRPWKDRLALLKQDYWRQWSVLPEWEISCEKKKKRGIKGKTKLQTSSLNYRSKFLKSEMKEHVSCVGPLGTLQLAGKMPFFPSRIPGSLGCFWKASGSKKVQSFKES